MELKPGEIICPHCKGNYIVGEEKTTIWGCEKCLGSGKLDWIEAIVGKRTDIPIVTSTQLQAKSRKMYPKEFSYPSDEVLNTHFVDYIDLVSEK